ncbi:MAG: dienelactone hydrolase family protein [Ignavibacteria bacterium]|nr:dienelactone hydrolase family protein [Ignavibacteria bacterium]
MFTLSLCLFLCLGFVATAGDTKSCCSATKASATSKFASLTSEKSFRNAHLEPVPLAFEAEKGTWKSLKTSDGTDTKIFEVKSDKPTSKFVFMIHEWWGLNEYIQRGAERLQKELPDVTVIALDLYDGNIATDRENAAKFMGSVKQERAQVIIKSAIEYCGPKAMISTIGWCFGGGWSLQTTLLAGKQAAGCVMYYGMPETDIAKLKTLTADVLGIFAKQDQWINPGVVSTFEKNMKAAGKKLTVKMYDADHAFANPSNPKFDKVATEDAHINAVEFLKSHLK